MRRIRAGRALVGLLLWYGAGSPTAVGSARVLAAEEPPPLFSPSANPAGGMATESPSPSQAQTTVPEIDNRPMLVIPGVNAPGPGRMRTRSLPLPALEPAGPPIIVSRPMATSGVGPVPEVDPLTPSRPGVVVSTPGRVLGLESVPGSVPGTAPGARSPAPASATGSQPAATSGSVRRPSGWLGRFLPATPFSLGSRPDVDRDGSVSGISGEPSLNTDPAVEAALKRRIERQIRDSLGDRVSGVEVRVVGRDVTIRAHTTRFWQRRTVRRTLESLPGLAGYRATVDLLD